MKDNKIYCALNCTSIYTNLFNLIRGIIMNKNIFVFLGLSVLLLTACNTMEGAGRDIKAGGKNLEKSAQEHKPN